MDFIRGPPPLSIGKTAISFDDLSTLRRTIAITIARYGHQATLKVPKESTTNSGASAHTRSKANTRAKEASLNVPPQPQPASKFATPKVGPVATMELPSSSSAQSGLGAPSATSAVKRLASGKLRISLAGLKRKAPVDDDRDGTHGQPALSQSKRPKVDLDLKSKAEGDEKV